MNILDSIIPKNLIPAVGMAILIVPACRAPAADLPAADMATLTAAISRAQPGDTITMASGAWTNADILFRARGNSGSPITLRAQAPGQVYLTGGSRVRLDGRFLAVDGLVFRDGHAGPDGVIEFRGDIFSPASNCRVKNCAILDFNDASRSGAGSSWVTLYGFSNRVDHCYFRGKTDAGPLLIVFLPSPVSPDAIKPNYHHVDHNYFGQRPALGQNGAETIRVGDSTTSFDISNTIVEANYFKECNGEVEIISNKSCKNTYRYNTFVDCEGTLTLRHGNRCTVQGNFFFGHGKALTGGVRVLGEGHRVYNNYFEGLAGAGNRAALCLMQGLEQSPLDGYFQVKGTILAFNTLVGCTNNLVIGLPSKVEGTLLQTTLPPTGCRIANNIFQSSLKRVVDQRIEPVAMAWEGNLMFAAAPGVTNSGTLVTDPLLVPGADGIWRPGPQSPALGAARGTAYSFVTTDIDGQTRPAGPWDVGCDQASETPVSHRPLGEKDVGPSWMKHGLLAPALTRAAPRLETVAVGNGGFAFQWQTAPGSVYRVQFSEDLQTWRDLGSPIPGTGAPESWLEDKPVIPGQPGAGLRVFRVRQTR